MAGKSRLFFSLPVHFNRKLLIFSICLAISALFWFLLAFNGYYSTRIIVPVEYMNMPGDQFLAKNLPAKAEIEISGTGYQLLTYMIRPERATVTLSGHLIGTSSAAGKGDAFLSTSQGIDHFNRFHSDVKALRMWPDTIYFNFFAQGYRKIPVKLNTDLQFEKQFGIAGQIKFQPDSIQVSGPSAILNTLLYIETDTLKLSGINQSATYPVKIRQPYKELNYAPVEIPVRIEVDKYTEAQFDIPLKLEHLKNEDSVRVSPAVIKLICTVSLGNYARLNADSFIVAVDLHELRSKKLKANIRKAPSFVRNVRIEPDHVDCVVRKK